MHNRSPKDSTAVARACVAGIALLLLPFLVLLVLVSTTARSFVALLAKITRPDLAGLFHDRGITFATERLYRKPLTIIVAHFVVNGSVSVDTLREKFRQRVLNPQTTANLGASPELSFVSLARRWTTFMGYVFWQWDPKFEVANHIRLYDYKGATLTLPSLATERDLERVTAVLLTVPFSEACSPWEILVVPKYKSTWNTDGQEQSVIILRIHHALADGRSIFNLLLRLTDQEHVKLPAARFLGKINEESRTKKLRSSLLLLPRIPLDFAEKILVQWDEPNAWSSRCHRPSHYYRTLFSGPVRVSDVKEIMRKYSVCFNAAIYSITAGAMIKAMEEMGQEVPGKLAAFYPLPLPSEHPKGLCNYVSADVFTFHPHTQPTSSLRLDQIARQVRPASDPAVSPVWFDWLAQLVPRLPAKLISAVSHAAGYTLLVTNFAGPMSQVDVCGTGKIVEIITAMTGSHANLACAVMYSVAGVLRITLNLDTALLQQPHQQLEFHTYVQQEIEELLMSASCKQDMLPKCEQQVEVMIDLEQQSSH